MAEKNFWAHAIEGIQPAFARAESDRRNRKAEARADEQHQWAKEDREMKGEVIAATNAAGRYAAVGEPRVWQNFIQKYGGEDGKKIKAISNVTRYGIDGKDLENPFFSVDYGDGKVERVPLKDDYKFIGKYVPLDKRSKIAQQTVNMKMEDIANMGRAHELAKQFPEVYAIKNEDGTYKLTENGNHIPKPEFVRQIMQTPITDEMKTRAAKTQAWSTTQKPIVYVKDGKRHEEVVSLLEHKDRVAELEKQGYRIEVAGEKDDAKEVSYRTADGKIKTRRVNGRDYNEFAEKIDAAGGEILTQFNKPEKDLTSKDEAGFREKAISIASKEAGAQMLGPAETSAYVEKRAPDIYNSMTGRQKPQRIRNPKTGEVMVLKDGQYVPETAGKDMQLVPSHGKPATGAPAAAPAVPASQAEAPFTPVAAATSQPAVVGRVTPAGLDSRAAAATGPQLHGLPPARQPRGAKEFEGTGTTPGEAAMDFLSGIQARIRQGLASEKDIADNHYMASIRRKQQAGKPLNQAEKVWYEDLIRRGMMEKN